MHFTHKRFDRNEASNSNAPKSEPLHPIVIWVMNEDRATELQSSCDNMPICIVDIVHSICPVFKVLGKNMIVPPSASPHMMCTSRYTRVVAKGLSSRRLGHYIFQACGIRWNRPCSNSSWS